MYCWKCGKAIPYDSEVCPECKTDILLRAKPLAEPDQTLPAAVLEETPPEEAPIERKKCSGVSSGDNAIKRHKRRIKAAIISASVCVVLLGAVVLAMVLTESSYQNAMVLMSSDPLAAESGFAQLGEYKDAQEQAQECQRIYDYNVAAAQMESGDYQGALKIFTALGSYSDAALQAEECQRAIDYDAALSLMEIGHYEDAAASFESLGTYRDATDLAKECRYKRAGELYKSGKYYSAYLMYTALGDYMDSAEQASGCAQPYPESSIVYLDPHYEGNVSLTISAPNDGYYTLVEIFTGSNEINGFKMEGHWIGTVCIAPGEKITVKLRGARDYSFKEAHGMAWYGLSEMFGEDGVYSVLTVSGSDEIEFDAFSFYNEYELTLRTSYGNVQGYAISREDF
jgi:tetratricopeptide (TPR) repeat protein